MGEHRGRDVCGGLNDEFWGQTARLAAEAEADCVRAVRSARSP